MQENLPGRVYGICRCHTHTHSIVCHVFGCISRSVAPSGPFTLSTAALLGGVVHQVVCSDHSSEAQVLLSHEGEAVMVAL